jgi:excisionase family DNA binding protein
MTERAAAERLGCSVDTLRRERRAGKIKFTMIRDRVRYTEAHLAGYIEAQEQGGCVDRSGGSGKSADTGSAGAPIRQPGAEPGTTQAHDKRAAHLLAQAIFKRLS